MLAHDEMMCANSGKRTESATHPIELGHVMRAAWMVAIILLACLAAFFGFGGYAPGGAPAAQVLYYILLACSFAATVWSIRRAA